MTGEGIIKVIKIPPKADLNVCIKFYYSNPDIALTLTNVDLIVTLEQKSGDHLSTRVQCHTFSAL